MADQVAHVKPIIVIDTAEPAIRGKAETGHCFRCERCSHLLIERYLAYEYASIGLKCFVCEHVSFTPPSPPGEVFSMRSLRFSDDRIYRISTTIDKESGIVFAASSEVLFDPELTSPALDAGGFDATEDGLSALVEAYKDATGADYEKQAGIVARSPTKFKEKLLFAWAMAISQEQVSRERWDFDDPNVSDALLYLTLFKHCVNRWGRHPRFRLVASGFGKPGSFLHTAGLLIEAVIMYEENARVGLALEDLQGEPNPDLYLVGLQEPRTYLEVKAPVQFQTVDASADDRSIEATVKQIVDRSKSQINRQRPGLLVLFSTAPRNTMHADVLRYVENAVRRVGRSRTGLAGIGILTLNRSALSDRFEIAFTHDIVTNPHFGGRNSFVAVER